MRSGKIELSDQSQFDELNTGFVASYLVNFVAFCSRDSSVRPEKTVYARRENCSAFYRTPLPGVDLRAPHEPGLGLARLTMGLPPPPTILV